MLDPKPLEFNFESTDSITCEIKSESSHLTWFNNKHQKVNFTSETRITASKDGRLTIKDIQLSDGGTYECRGLDHIRYYTIYVNGRPT